MAGGLPEKLSRAGGLSRVSGQVSCVGQKLPTSGRASTIATLRPAFWRYVAAGIPPEMPPPTTMTSNTSIPVLLAHGRVPGGAAGVQQQDGQSESSADGCLVAARAGNKLPVATGGSRPRPTHTSWPGQAVAVSERRWPTHQDLIVCTQEDAQTFASPNMATSTSHPF